MYSLSFHSKTFEEHKSRYFVYVVKQTILVKIDFDYMDKNILNSRKKAYRFRTTCEWVNYDNVHFWLNYSSFCVVLNLYRFVVSK